MLRAVAAELADGQRFFVYGGTGHEPALRAIMSGHGVHRLWSASFVGDEGDEDGRRHFGQVNAWARVYLYRDSVIVELDMGRTARASKGTGEFPNAGQYVPDRRIYPHDARLTHEQAGRFVADFLTSVDLPTSIEWQVPVGTVAEGPLGRRLP